MSIDHMLTRTAFGIALFLGGATAAAAQGLPGGANTLNESHGDWTVSCVAPEGLAQCAMGQTLISAENGQRALAVELRLADDRSSAEAVMFLPFGLRLDDGVTLAIDDAAPMATLRFSTCLPAGCQLSAVFAEDSLAAMRAGDNLMLTTVGHQTGQNVSFSVSLRGFASALNRMAELVAS